MDNNQKAQGVIAWFVHNPVAANLLMVLILVAGGFAAIQSRVESFPSLPPTSITVSVEYQSGSARSAEESIAIKIEDAVQGVDGIKQIASSSDSDGVTVTITKSSGYSLEKLQQDVKSEVDAIGDLPSEAKKPVITRQADLEDVISINLFGDVPIDALQSYLDELRNKLLDSPLIQKVDYIGRKTQQVSIEVDEAKLQAFNLTMDHIVSQIRAESLTQTAGELKGSQGTLVLKTDQQHRSATELASLPIKRTAGGQTILLSDVAHVELGFDDDGSITRYNGQPSVGLTVKMYGQSNINLLAQETRSIVDAYQLTLPSGINLTQWNDQSEPITHRLSLLLKNSAQGIALVVILLALLLNIRVAFWVAVGLPVTFAGAMVLMGDSFFGLTLNELTTFGFIMALGIVVDDAVVIGESIYEQREKHGASVESTIAGAQKVATPTTFGVLTTIVAFMSLSLVEGELGKIFAQFAMAATFCLIFSLIESKLILPAHLARVKMEPGSARGIPAVWHYVQQRILRGFKYITWHIYKPCLQLVLRYRYAVICGFVSLCILISGSLITGKLKSVFFPEISNNFITIELAFEEDAGYGLVQRQTLKVEQMAASLNDSLMSQYGLSVAPIQSVLVETTNSSSQIIVGLSGNAQRPISAGAIAKEWQSVIPLLEGIDSANFLADMISDKAISIELRSQNETTISNATHELTEHLSHVQGVHGIKSSLANTQAQVDISVNESGLAMGLTTANLLQQLNMAYQGYEIQQYQQGSHEIKVKIQYPHSKRQTLDNLKYAQVRLGNGKLVPLNAVANISTRYVSKNIERINRNRVNVITADVDKTIASPEDIINNLDGHLFKELQKKYRDLNIVLSGQQQEQEQISNSLYSVFAIALIGIYALLAIPLNSYFQPLLIMCTIPFGIVGALMGHLIQGIPISVLSLFGMLALTGVVVNDSLLLISRFNTKITSGDTVYEALIESGTGRLRAIVLTSATTYFGLVPLLSETSPQAQFLIPAATSMGYGILFATVITLILVPVLLMVQEDIKQLYHNIITQRSASFIEVNKNEI
ncbi:efflux RND transporter permease subunit [Vibrio sp. 10N.261.46.A3]|uniref:efflux RND transporter permease subunit n=1 Tax=Vibrio sp. 10N.261.46.A3 TaxID=3229658 RepID=UPI00355072D9